MIFQLFTTNNSGKTQFLEKPFRLNKNDSTIDIGCGVTTRNAETRRKSTCFKDSQSI